MLNYDKESDSNKQEIDSNKQEIDSNKQEITITFMVEGRREIHSPLPT